MDKEQLLLKNLKDLKKVAVAFSGGVDSAYLLYAATVAECDVIAYFVKSEFQPEFEVEDARQFAKLIGAKLKVLEISVIEETEITRNNHERCYFCKQKIMKAIKAQALIDGFETIVDGSNATDAQFFRAGVRALKECGVLSPLKDVCLFKDEIRQLSHKANLFTADKPSYSCLATRVMEQEIKIDILAKIDQAEKLLREMNFTDFRVRVYANKTLLEFNLLQREKAENEFDKIKNELSKLFEVVELSNVWR